MRSTITIIIGLVAIFGSFIVSVGISNVAYALNFHSAAVDIALGQLTRAESAQTPDQVIRHVTVAKELLPEHGYVFWWSPDKANFESIQTELDDIVSRAENISTLKLGDELFNSEMYDMHARLRVIQETLVGF